MHTPSLDKIICIGKNYLEHARELGDAVPEKPVLFLKPPSALVSTPLPEALGLPVGRGEVHPECEIVLRLGPDLKPEAFTLGLDLTLRDLQAQLKKAGHPWEISKAFPRSAVTGEWLPWSTFKDSEEFRFTVDGTLRQKGRAQEMRLSPLACIAHAADHFELRSGDLVFTGTPAGVAAVKAGSAFHASYGEKNLLTGRF
jgi:2-keto-4-pentenoate hydratase/2-oxohepta-3-ene-1,7-dioic acid hydratase in catechol pathway